MFVPSTSKDKLILALDGMDKVEVHSLINKLPDLLWVKVGLELFVNSGGDILKSLRDKGLKIFLDLKFHDIPMTMSGACRQAAQTGAQMISVHACSGYEALRQANQAALEGAASKGISAPTLLAVTVLTSWDARSFSKELCIDQEVHNRVQLLASLAQRAGIGGCVSSPLEVKALRNIFPEPFELVTPGIRPKDSDIGDQVRVMTPSKALEAGSSRIVIGRPITQACDPRIAFESICRELELVN